MHSLIIITILAGACIAHYRDGYDNRNLIEREEPTEQGVLVECPVCDNIDGMPNLEKCKTIRGRQYKKCERGTYENKVCGNRLDCYRGPGEKCSEKMTFDFYGIKCARGFDCNDALHVCTGPGYTIDSNTVWLLKGLYHYPLSLPRQGRPFTKSESDMILA